MAIDRSDKAWYRDAVVYQLHIKAFFDANGDGVGDFEGLIAKLDYIRDLGVTAIWLLPFYPSPLRDDGYDIADYEDIHPTYGKLGDFKRLLRAAHERGLRVITELVINHTSDQHPWFQRARKAKPGSAARDYYVWSDTDQRYQGTRVIFLDTEKSNWTWDPVAEAYYWHRFYAHQPDLNFANPAVLKAITSAMHFWLEMGVDGLRLDAVPYLCERDGTNNENLPETHSILKRIRAEVDAHYSDRMLLAEANQWPEDTQEYFGSGDECHMAFHFPLMPRMYMAIAQEDRHPITDILRQTPEIPNGCQWAVFLRNHDELTLEMVTDQERDYLWNFYAADRRARLNLGIRRRLAPLLENDRRKVELMASLLLSMPGTPVVYYGDEIGMGDNIYLGDRDGVRTPMQWTPDRNGGFSRADPQRLYLPAIMDPTYGFAAVNVEAQQGNPSSLLNWTRRMVAVRQRSKVFGRGDYVFLHPRNRKVLAFLRRYEKETVLCVANLSRSAQAAEIDLAELRGRIPMEMLGGARFPAIGEAPLMVTLAGYGFYWFELQEPAGAGVSAPAAADAPELVTLVLRQGVEDITTARNAPMLEREVLPAYLPKQRWFGAKDERLQDARVVANATLPGGNSWLGQVEVNGHAGTEAHRYFVPLSHSFATDGSAATPAIVADTLARVRIGAKSGPLFDATADPRFALDVVEAMRRQLTIPGRGGSLHFTGGKALADLRIPEGTKAQRVAADQSNSSVNIGDLAMLKIYRRLRPGEHPEIEMGRHLTEVAGYTNAPAHLGAIEHVAENGTTTAVAVLRAYVAAQGDGWHLATEQLKREFETLMLKPADEAPDPATTHAAFLVRVATLGRRAAELHRALAVPDNEAFQPETLGASYFDALGHAIERQVQAAYEALGRSLANLDEAACRDAQLFLDAKEALLTRLHALVPTEAKVTATRVHGDLTLGNVVSVKEDWYILDFEGNPSRPLAERRAKAPPLRDVASMLRSIDYAARVVAFERAGMLPTAAADAEFHALAWRDAAHAVFLAAYHRAAAGSPGWLEDEGLRGRLTDLYLLEKALYEVSYEAANRPLWLRIPVRGILEMLGLGKVQLEGASP